MSGSGGVMAENFRSLEIKGDNCGVEVKLYDKDRPEDIIPEGEYAMESDMIAAGIPAPNSV
jgi:hypothetical protein